MKTYYKMSRLMFNSIKRECKKQSESEVIAYVNDGFMLRKKIDALVIVD